MQIIRVDSAALLRRFIDLPYWLYKDNPYWVPPLRLDMHDQLSPKKYPSYKYIDQAFFLATDGKRDLGRIAVFHNRKHNEIYHVNRGMFGYLEMVDNQAVTAALFDAATQWLEPYGATDIIGPFNPDINGTIGLLMDSFDSPPMILMTYNPDYYSRHLDELGMVKLKDVWAWDMHSDENPLSERLIKFTQANEARGKFTIRPAKMKNFWDELERVKIIYNAAWAENWGAMWMDDAEFEHIAKDLKLILDPDLLFIAEVDGEVAGFSLALPNIHEALQHLKNGRLLPTGLFKLLWYKRKITSLRVFTMGVLKPYRRMGIDASFYVRTIQTGLEKGYIYGEASWVLEDNHYMNNALERLGATKNKTYRIYSKLLNHSTG